MVRCLPDRRWVVAAILFSLCLYITCYVGFTGPDSLYFKAHGKRNALLNQSLFTGLRRLFEKRTTDEEKAIFRELVLTLTESVPESVTYFLYAGALLGSYRHHGMVPWDDDVDIMVRYKDNRLLWDSLLRLSPEFKIQIINRHALWKMHDTKSKLTNRKWPWPYIDIFFYQENATHIWDSYFRNARIKIDKRIVFPLTKRPFLNFLLPAPRCTRRYLDTFFNVSMCRLNRFDHKYDANFPVSSRTEVPCEYFEDKFPFVKRRPFDRGTLEILEQNHSYVGNHFAFLTDDTDSNNQYFNC